MPFQDTNSHLTTKPYNFGIKCQTNSESYDRHGFLGTKLMGGQNFVLTVVGFFNEREYSAADWLVPLVLLCCQRNMRLISIKTKTMIFTPLRAYDIAPTISISPGTWSEVVEESKILGTIVRSDMHNRIAEWLEAQPLAQRVWGSIPLFGQNVKSGKPFRK